MPESEENKVITPDGQEEKKTENVTLSKEEYAEMVGKMTQMEGAIKQFLESETEKNERENIEKAQKREQEISKNKQDLDVNLLDNKQLLGLIFTEVENRMAKPLLQMVSTLAVKDEKRDLEKHMIKNGENIEDYEEEIFKIATQKPTLSLMEVYKLVKADRKSEKKEEKKEEPEKDKGTKPGGGKFTPGGKLSLEEASRRAMEELKGTFPE